MRIVVQVSQKAAPSLHKRGRATKAVRALKRITRELGIELEPVHPDIEDPVLETYFTAEVPDAESTSDVIDRLQSSSIVEAAYFKPEDELA